uniref:Secreted protein n=1 Tax=Nelumbo nucifera TaxID=4432 RepID=A0A822ZL84_NELNU|nr:TPA_asm: hypothetical protein HUJ06_000737 [Nelumbo nucifera]
MHNFLVCSLLELLFCFNWLGVAKYAPNNVAVALISDSVTLIRGCFFSADPLFEPLFCFDELGDVASKQSNVSFKTSLFYSYKWLLMHCHLMVEIFYNAGLT